MSEINLHNYEAYMLDYMEGNLSNDLTIELMAFANERTELDIDIFDNVTDLTFEAHPISYSNKEELKVHNEEALFDKMVGIIEGEYSAQEIEKIEEEITTKALEKQYAYFKATKLSPPKEVFENKGSLKVDTGRVVPLVFLKYGSIAAALVVGIFALSYSLTNSSNTGAERELNGLAIEKMSTQPNNHNFKYEREIINNSKENPFISNNSNEFVAYQEIETPKVNINDSSKIETPTIQEVPIEDNIVQENPKIDSTITWENPTPLEDDIASTNVVTKSTEPYSLITNAMSNVIKNDVAYVKEESHGGVSNTVTHRFSIGKFSFERKKSN